MKFVALILASAFSFVLTTSADAHRRCGHGAYCGAKSTVYWEKRIVKRGHYHVAPRTRHYHYHRYGPRRYGCGYRSPCGYRAHHRGYHIDW
jgi:hypothetical protein